MALAHAIRQTRPRLRPLGTVPLAGLAVLAPLLAPLPARAVTVYRCSTPAGLRFQNTPCPRAAQDQYRYPVIQPGRAAGGEAATAPVAHPPRVSTLTPGVRSSAPPPPAATPVAYQASLDRRIARRQQADDLSARIAGLERQNDALRRDMDRRVARFRAEQGYDDSRLDNPGFERGVQRQINGLICDDRSRVRETDDEIASLRQQLDQLQATTD